MRFAIAEQISTNNLIKPNQLFKTLVELDLKQPCQVLNNELNKIEAGHRHKL